MEFKREICKQVGWLDTEKMIYSPPSLNAACSVASWRSMQPEPLDGHRRENVKGVPKNTAQKNGKKEASYVDIK
jgi:hypothetical protein